MKQKRRKGATLAELCVVIAVASIISALTVSFAIMVNRRSVLSQAKVAVMEDVEAVRLVMDAWLSDMTLLGAAFEVKDGVLTAQKDGALYTPGLADGNLRAALPSAPEYVCAVYAITGIAFDMLEKPEDRIFYITVTYRLPYAGDVNDMKTYTYTFCSNPRVGDSVGESGGPA